MATAIGPATRLVSSPTAAARTSDHLPTLLSVIAGMVDVTGFLTLGGLFTAHVTGNIVVIAAILVRGGSPDAPQVLAVPVFIVAVSAVWLIARVSNRRGQSLLRPLLVVQLLLLAFVLVLGAVSDLQADPSGPLISIAAILATSAMACQFALLRLAVPGAPSTAVMTGNLTNTMLSFLDAIWRARSLTEADRRHLQQTTSLLIGFFGGCVAGAMAVSLVKDWSWALPVAASAATLAPAMSARQSGCRNDLSKGE